MDFFTSSNGRISGVFRFSKRHLANIQTFHSVQVSWKGSNDLKTIISCEQEASAGYLLTGKSLFCGLYLNELLQRSLPLDDPYVDLFNHYEASLSALVHSHDMNVIEAVLRQFEFFLLTQMGFQLNFGECVESGRPIDTASFYRYFPERGFVLSRGEANLLIAGADLLALYKKDYSTASTLKSAKKIARIALKSILGTKPLKSRELFY